MAWLHHQIARGRFRSGTLLMLRKSHTHDRIGLACFEFPEVMHGWTFLSLLGCHDIDMADQLWGILSRRLANSDKMLTDEARDYVNFLQLFSISISWDLVLSGIQDMVSILREECAKPGLRSWVGINTEIQVKKVNATQIIGNVFQ